MSQFQLKPLSAGAVEAALEKAERYRLLNEPVDAESICRDVLRIEPDNQAALVNLILALTDQFELGLSGRMTEAKQIAARLRGRYEQAYYLGIICERAAKFHHRRETPISGNIGHELLCEAMQHYEAAEKDRPPGNDDALLRWNTCARIIMRHPEIQPRGEVETVHELE